MLLPIKTLTIDRAKWLRGEDSVDTYLLRKRDGKMCCLGFLCLAAGFSRLDITDVGEPSDIINPNDTSDYLEGTRDEARDLMDHPQIYRLYHSYDVPFAKEPEEAKYQTDACKTLIGYNDDRKYSAEEREQHLTEEFKKHLNINLIFIDTGGN
jgi:hypothetical protein